MAPIIVFTLGFSAGLSVCCLIYSINKLIERRSDKSRRISSLYSDASGIKELEKYVNERN